MFYVERNEEELIVRGPEGFRKRLAVGAIGVVLRANAEDPYDSPPARYTVRVGSMTDEEAVAFALEILSYPQ